MAAKVYGNATFVDCPGVESEGKYYHAMRDGCWSCAPYWERIPTCSICGSKLKHSESKKRFEPGYEPKGYCISCKKHFTLVDEERIRIRV